MAVLALALPACRVDRAQPSGAPSTTARCDAVQNPPLQAGEHLIGRRPPPVPYSSTPPTSGWHASGAFEIAIVAPERPLAEPQQVSVLEAGGVVVTYNALPGADRRQLERHVRERYDGRVAVTAYDPLPSGHVAFTAWGALQRCDAVDLAALDAFASTYADPEPAVPGRQ
jgi:hypothetical protein